jgi:hypothetical protein
MNAMQQLALVFLQHHETCCSADNEAVSFKLTGIIGSHVDIIIGLVAVALIAATIFGLRKMNQD